jgi:hypothetical protein
MSARDSQRQRVYDWEWSLGTKELNTRLTWEGVEGLVHLIWENWRPGTTPPQVRNMGNRQIAARGCRAYVQFPKWAWTPHVILHECAHALNDNCQQFRYRKSDKCAAHGPEFVRIYCDLIKWFTNKNVVNSARERGVKVAASVSYAKPQKPRTPRMFAKILQSVPLAKAQAEAGVPLTKKGTPDRRYKSV